MNRKARRDMERAWRRADKQGKSGQWVKKSEKSELEELDKELALREAQINQWIEANP